MNPFLLCLSILASPLLIYCASSNSSAPLKCADTGRLCTSFLAFRPPKGYTLSLIESMFDVLREEITVEGNPRGYLFIKKNCSCTPSQSYTAMTTYTIRSSGGVLYDSVLKSYAGLAIPPNSTRVATAGAVVSVKLICGCSSGLWNYLMTYVMAEGDSLASLSSRFGVSMETIENINRIRNPDNVSSSSIIFVPLNSVPGRPIPLETSSSPSSPPLPGPSSGTKPKRRNSTGLIIGASCVAFLLVILLVAVPLVLRRSSISLRMPRSRTKEKDQKGKESINSSFPNVTGNTIFEAENPVVFTHEEIRLATENFSDANLLGHGKYGSVYCGHLRDQEVAVKRMTATKTKEFLSEISILCKVHHANLIELIGHGGTNDELFLVYEYAENGSLQSHLQDHKKGTASLSWVMRVQIALDAARGLEYIHDHTKTHYVHRDVKSSNILLDHSYRAKIADFGLAKLVEGDCSVTKVVGTYGYVAPEYLREGLATCKSDVYAFGVVLFEIISGREAIIRDKRRSLASMMAEAVGKGTWREWIDPNLGELYGEDCLHEVAKVGRQCVEEDPILRPEMKEIVICLSRILLSSLEWEASLAGNSQIFSGLVQGR